MDWSEKVEKRRLAAIARLDRSDRRKAAGKATRETTLVGAFVALLEAIKRKEDLLGRLRANLEEGAHWEEQRIERHDRDLRRMRRRLDELRRQGSQALRK